MTKRKAPNKAEPGKIVEWVMLGWLAACIEDHGRITVDDWNGAIEAAERAKTQEDASLSQ